MTSKWKYLDFEHPFNPLKVLDLPGALELVNQKEPGKWNVVSLWSDYYEDHLDEDSGLYVPGELITDQPIFTGAKALSQHFFHDIDDISQGGQLCTLEQIKEVLEFTVKCKGEPLLVHCHAGISRSTAMATLIVLDAIKEVSNNPYTDALTMDSGN